MICCLGTQIYHLSSTFFSDSVRNFTCKHFPPAFPWRSSWTPLLGFFWFALCRDSALWSPQNLKSSFLSFLCVSQESWAHMSFLIVLSQLSLSRLRLPRLWLNAMLAEREMFPGLISLRGNGIACSPSHTAGTVTGSLPPTYCFTVYSFTAKG